MKTLTLAAIAAALVAASTPALAKTDCDGGYKTFLGKMSIYVDKMSGYELADAVRKSLDAYNSCKAGDSFSPHGVWDQILADMQSKAGK
ncbi:MAG TPA: hypothetical protein VJ045_03930 [Hyphomicrobiaceae bacterium]|nr:hypothetical protein [Hyphomicrobiaceae bacterium]